MPFSPLVHLIALGLVGGFLWAARRVDPAGEQRGAALGLAIGMLLWIALATALALVDFFYAQNARFLPVVVGSVLPVALILGAAARLPSVRRLLERLIRELPIASTVAVQAVRVTAVGTIFKMLSGELPVHFVLPAGVPDLLVGLSAIYVSRHADRLSDRFLIAWNVAGVAVFLVALVAMQLSLPGPLEVFHGEPTARMVVSFPMALVPTFVAPMFILAHLLTLAQLVQRRSRGETDPEKLDSDPEIS